MTELEHAIKHIKTRADAWAVKEVTEALRSISEKLEKAISQECVEPTQKHVENALDMRCEDAIRRDAVCDYIAEFVNNEYSTQTECDMVDLMIKGIKHLPSVTQKSGKCKNCKYFEYDSVAKVDGIPLIVAHEICNKWGDGCKTKEDGYCFMYEPQESEDKGC